MKTLLLSILLVFSFATLAAAQEDVVGFDTAKKARWQKFNKFNFNRIDFSKRKLT
jgi:hypothetical protein